MPKGNRGGGFSAGKAIGITVLLITSAALAYAAGKIAEYTIGKANGFVDIVVNPLVAFKEPLHLELSNMTVVSAMLIAALVPFLFWMIFSSSRQKLDNEDTGKEHGDDRLATIKEMSASKDKKHPFNNIVYSQNTGLVLDPYDKKTFAAIEGRNLNTCTFGISGLGKTFNIVKPNIMQACGNALPEMRYGLKNVPAHYKRSKVGHTTTAIAAYTKAVFVAIGQRFSYLTALISTIVFGTAEEIEEKKREKAERDSAKDLMKKTDFSAWNAVGEPRQPAEGETPDTLETENQETKEPVKPETKESENQETKKPRNLGKRKPRHVRDEDKNRVTRAIAEVSQDKPWAQRNAFVEAQRQIEASKKLQTVKKKAADMLGAGFDIVNTDPKGDNVRDVGWLLLAAGFDLKVFNTIDFEEGLPYNPLAYIDTQLVDIKPAEEITVDVTATAPETHVTGAPEIKKEIAGMDVETGKMLSAAPHWVVSAQIDMHTESVGLTEVPRTDLPLKEIERRLNELDPKTEEFQLLKKQRDMKWMEADMGSYVIETSEAERADMKERGERELKYKLVKGGGCTGVYNAVKTMRYKRSSGQVVVEFKNNNPSTIPAVVDIKLDPALVVTDSPVCTSGTLECPDPNDPENKPQIYRWVIPQAARKPVGVGADEHICEKLVLSVHIMPTKIADGVGLTKTVDCLCANLEGTDAESNKSSDPFWEDTKRLCFMSLISFLFERYDETQQTLPEMMRLLNIALDDSNDPSVKSPLAVLMEMWEQGIIYEDTPPEQGEGGGRVRGGRWVTAKNLPHSRDNSMALHCYHAFTAGADDTVRSIIISCQAALHNLLAPDVREMLSRDELHLETLGDADQKQVLFIVTKDTDSPYDFLTALVTFQAIDIAQEKAYRRYGGRLPRHVRFELDEVANIGKIPILIRAMAVVRSRNISISMYLQSKAQLAMVYGEKEADVILDNCSAILFLGAQTKDTLEEMSVKVGVETVQSRMLQRSSQDSSLYGSTSEQISSNERRVMSSSQLARMTKGWMMVFLFNERAAYDHKFKTLQHPYYAYIDPESKRRDWKMPLPVFDKRFEYSKYRRGEYDGEYASVIKR